MTFKTRLVLASAIAVAIAVLLASAGALVVARNALTSSTDSTLQNAAEALLSRPFVDTNDRTGAIEQIVSNDGSILVASPAGELPVNDDVKEVAAGHQSTLYQNVEIDKALFRELAVTLPVGTAIGGGNPQILSETGALQLFVPLSGVNSQLTHLLLTLLAIAAIGVLIAVLLGLLVARTALRPLNAISDSVEEIAETTDLSQRLAEGRADELGRLRRAFNRLFAAVERSEDQQRQLVLDASHELRTPLTSLRTNTEVLKRVDELDPDTRAQLLDDVLTQLTELTTLVGDLAELARGEHQVEPPTRFRLDQLVDDLVAVDATHARTRSIEIVADLDACWVKARRDRLARAIGNLIDNAIKWSPDGGVIEVTVADGVVEVRDHGPGIATKDLPKIFDRFYRSPEARAMPGSGLGLAIVSQVVAEEGGSVAAQQAEGGGALLRLELPTVS
jgi:two-component system, OmpR family, sensor histidine kinase MprB